MHFCRYVAFALQTCQFLLMQRHQNRFENLFCFSIYYFQIHFFNMVHINDLDPKVFYQILCLASGESTKDIDEWKEKLTLLQVCTKWYEVLKSNVFSQGFVDICSLKHNTDLSIYLERCVYYADSNIICISNLGIITGRDKHNCSCVTELKVVISHNLDIDLYGHVLKKLLTLGIGFWPSLVALHFNSDFHYSYIIKPYVPDLSELSETVLAFICDIQSKAPNIAQLELGYCNDKVLLIVFCTLVNHYAPHLQRLHINHSIKSPLPLFSTELTSLSLGLGDYTHRHASFHAKSLQYLSLRDICSSNFSWWIFHGVNTPGQIEFTNLRTLNLSYRDQTDGEKRLSEMFSKQARLHGSHMLRFPRLESLTLKQPPVDCKVLFTDTISTHLDTLVIHGNCSSAVAASRLQLMRVNSMKILVSGDEALNNNLYAAADQYFEHTQIGSSCVADFRLSIKIQRTASWVNITDLKLVDIEAGELVRLVQDLYNLRKFEVHIVYTSNECLSLIQSGLEEEERGEFELLDTRLEYLELYRSNPDNPHHVIALLNHLLLRTTTLKRVELSHEQYLLFTEKSFLPEKYPLTSFSI